MRQALGPGALGRPKGIGWRGRWEGGSGWGTQCKPMADSFQCMTKPTTIKEKISKQPFCGFSFIVKIAQKIEISQKKKIKILHEPSPLGRPLLVFQHFPQPFLMRKLNYTHCEIFSLNRS